VSGPDPTKVGMPASRRGDIVGGLTSAAVVIPKAMAYAAIAGLPLGVGLYTALIPLVVYAFVGTSRVLSVTTTSTIAILTAAALERVAPGADDAALVSAAATLACAVGAMLLLGWALRLGAAASFISEPVLVGFKAGLGIVIVVDQLPKLLGIHFEKGRFLQNVGSIVGHLPETSIPTILLGGATLVLLVALERYLPRVPASLVAVAGGIAATSLFGLDRHGIELVGEVRAGLPALSLPDTSLLADLWPSAIGIALMSFVETVAAGQAFRNAGEPRITANRELLAIGMTNILGGLFQNMPSGGGTSQPARGPCHGGARPRRVAILGAAHRQNATDDPRGGRDPPLHRDGRGARVPRDPARARDGI
jgi:SulP family sulfate permease